MKQKLGAKTLTNKKVLQKIKLILLILTIAHLFLLFGCTEMTRNEKNLCYSLSSKSFGYIPTCETENSCFSKVNELFKTELGYQQESNLYELKNNIARSWFFYNKAVKEVKNISKFCQTGNYSSLAGAINQTKSNIDNSFLELDSALKKSFEIISYEEKTLSEDKIDLVKEEPLYDSLTELRQILFELASEQTTGSDSYVAYYRKKVNEFNNSNAKKLSQQLVEETPFWIQGYNYLDGTILTELGLSTKGNFPFLSTALENAISYMEARFYTTQGLRELQNFPISDFMKLYSNLGGNSNSSLKRFADLINKISANKKATKQTIETLISQTEKELSLCKELNQKTEINKKYEALALELSLPSITSKENPKESLAKQIQEYLLMKENYSKGNLKLGERLLKLKENLNNFIEIKKQFEWEEKEISEKLKSACETKSNEIRKQKLISTNQNLQTLIENTLYYATKTQDSNDKKLDYCYEMVEKNKLLQEGVNNYLELEAKQKDSSKECVIYLENVFKETNLNELKLAFEKIKNQEINKENLSEFEQNCLNLKEQVDNELNNELESKELLEKYGQLQSLLEKLKQEQTYLDNEKLATTINEIQNKLLNYEKYFPDSKIDFSQTLPVKKVLLESINSSIDKASVLFEENIINYAKENLYLSCLTDNFIETDKSYLCTTTIIAPNPFFKIQKQFSLDLNLKFKEIINKSNCFSEINQTTQETLKINFSCLEYGSNEANLLTEERITKTEKDEFVYLSNESSLIKRSITLNDTLNLKKILIRTTPPPQTTKSIAIIDETEVLSYFDEQQNISFLAENVSNKTTITVFLYLEKIILTQTNYVSSNNGLITYTFKAQNTLGKELIANLLINLPTNKFVEKIEVFDETTTAKKHEILNEKIILKNQSFFGKEIKNYTIFVYTNSELEYYLEELKKQQDEFILLGETNQVNSLSLIISAGEKNTLTQLRKLVEENALKLAQLEKEKEKNNSIELMKQKIFEKIEELRQNASNLALLGLEKQSKECEILINKVLSLDLANENNITKALGLLSTAIFSVDEGIKKETEELTSKINSLGGYENNYEFNSLKDSFLKLKQTIFDNLAYDPAMAKKDFIELNKKYEEIILFKSQLDKNSQDYLTKLKKEVEKTYSNSKDLISFLEENLSDEAILIQEKILSPITQSRLKKLTLLLDEIHNSVKPFEQKLSELEEIYNELNRAKEILEKQAVTAYNKGIDNGLEKELLYKGKNFIDNNRYVDALLILSSKNQTSNGFLNNLPFTSFIPILLIIILAIVIKQAFGKKEKEESAKKNLILEEWKD